MTLVPLRKKKGWRAGTVTVTVLLTALLSACGGGSDDDDSSTTTPPEQSFGALGGKKTLVVHVDGLVMEPLQAALSMHPTLQELGELLPLRSGGYAGTSSEQQTKALPSWASLVTGTWAVEHGLSTVLPSTGPALKTPTVFDWVKQADPEAQTALVVSTPDYLTTLQTNVDDGDITALSECANDDGCVTTHSREAVVNGDDFILAQYSGLLKLSDQHGLGSAQYKQQLQTVLSDLDGLVALIGEREALAADESWQIVLVGSYGMDEFGSVSGAQFERNKTGWMLSNIPVSDTVIAAGDVSRGVLDHAAIVDVLPTVLAGMDAAPSAGNYAFNGNDLRNPVQLTKLVYDYNLSTYNLVLEWTLYSDAQFAAPVEIYREGQLLASVDATTRRYVDYMIPSGPEGELLPLRYEIRTQGGTAAVQTVVLPPPMLNASVLNGMVLYYPFLNGKADDVKQVSTFTPWNTANPGATWVTNASDLPYKPSTTPSANSALMMDLGAYKQGGLAGYKLNMANADVTTDPSVEAFTIGFWFKTNGVCIGGGSSVLANKDYDSGNNPGLAIGMFANCELRFNTGGGGNRDELQNFSLTPNEWAYVAVAVDKKNKQLYAYLMDPVAGQQNSQKDMADARVKAIGGTGAGLMGFGDDVTGKYSKNYSFTGVKSYSDLAVWNRLLTLDEVKNIYASRQPISALHP
ncbi:LamG-like jellyroll fold domain-containing protein [Paenalcaligenes sp. Me131]|uniref:LamG-like jellyroll fold domain-containing protein n=1 Tax=Paenalcaligenes sp. Me131 TaxID=3392636 RepID=UPI003D271F24